jgi:hypothetical protein
MRDHTQLRHLSRLIVITQADRLKVSTFSLQPEHLSEYEKC